MADLQTLFKTIDEMPLQEFKVLQRFVEDRNEQLLGLRPPLEEDVEARINALEKAFTEIREGLSEEELNEIVEAMNYVSIRKPELSPVRRQRLKPSGCRVAAGSALKAL